MATYYTDFSTGNDGTGTGTSGAPWKTLQKAINSSTGGDTIRVGNNAAEVLTSSISWASGFGTTTADTPLIIEAWDNGGSIVITYPDGTTRTAFEINGNDAVSVLFLDASMPSHVYISGMRAHSATARLFGIAGSWLLYESEFWNGGTTAMIISSGAAWRMIRCIFRDHAGSTSYGIGCGTGTHIINCCFANIQGNGIGPATYNVISGNTFYNVGYAAGKAAILVQNVDNVIIAHNTIDGAGSATGCYGIYANTTNAENNDIYGNIISNYGASGVAIKQDATSKYGLLGPNGFYNNAANYALAGTLPAIDNTAGDVIESTDPYTSYPSDLSLKSTSTFFAAMDQPMHKGGESYPSFGSVQQVAAAGGGETSSLSLG